jgi:H+/gluconate symporter-like permease
MNNSIEDRSINLGALFIAGVIVAIVWCMVIAYFQQDLLKQEKLEQARQVAEQTYQSQHKDDYLNWITMVPKTPVDDSWMKNPGK